jgi:hypothetical protein
VTRQRVERVGVEDPGKPVSDVRQSDSSPNRELVAEGEIAEVQIGRRCLTAPEELDRYKAGLIVSTPTRRASNGSCATHRGSGAGANTDDPTDRDVRKARRGRP